MSPASPKPPEPVLPTAAGNPGKPGGRFAGIAYCGAGTKGGGGGNVIVGGEHADETRTHTPTRDGPPSELLFDTTRRETIAVPPCCVAGAR